MNRLNVVLICLSLAIIMAKIATDPLLVPRTLALAYVIDFIYIVIFMLLLLLVLFIVQLAVVARDTKMKVAFMAAAILISCLFISQISFSPDDEMVISYFAYQSLAAGQNPYTQNYATALSPALNALAERPTFMLNGSIVGTYTYPALYLLVQIPFFAMFPFSQPNLAHLVMPAQYMAFFALFLLAYYLLASERKNQMPTYSAIMLVCLAALTFSSVILLLMLTLIVLLFTDIGRKWTWLILGIMASLQQELWVLVVLFIAYELWADWKRGLALGLNIAIVFIAMNGIFIAMNPYAFFHSFLSVTTLQPDSISILGSVLLLLGTPLVVLSILFLSTTILLAICVRYIGCRAYLPLLSAVPYLFIAHAIPIYYILPFAAFALVS